MSSRILISLTLALCCSTWSQVQFPVGPRKKPMCYIAFAKFNPKNFTKFEAELKKRMDAWGWDYIFDRQPGGGKDKNELGKQGGYEHRFRIYNNVDMIVNMSQAGGRSTDKASAWFQLFNDIPMLFSSPIRYVNQGGMMLANNTMDREDYSKKKQFFDNGNPFAQHDHPLWDGIPKDKPFYVTGPGVHILEESILISRTQKGRRDPFIFGPTAYHKSGRGGGKGTRWVLTFGIEKGTKTDVIGGIPFISEARRARTFTPKDDANDLAHKFFWNAFDWVAKDVKLRNVIHPKGPGDVNGDGQVSEEDLDKIKQHFATTKFDAKYDASADITEKVGVTAHDVWEVMKNMGKVYE